MKSSRFSVAIILAMSFAVSGCDSDRLAQFGAFAAAGTAYVTSFHVLTSDTGSAFIAADSATLITARNLAGDQVAANAATFRTSVAAEDVAMQNYLATLQKLDAHASLLGAYFAGITALTDGKASSATITSLDSLVDSINTFNPEIEKASFAGKNVKDFLGPVTTLVVDHFEVKALNEELKKSAPVIDKALSLQEAAVAALSAQLSDSLKASLQVQESTNVLNPYVTAGALPSSWTANREAFIRQNVTLQSADSAKTAITALHNAFKSLATNKEAKIDFSTLMSDIGKMAGFAAAAKASTP